MKAKFKSRQNVGYFLTFILLFVLIILPILTIFGQAVIVDGRFSLNEALKTINTGENLKTIKNSLLLGLLVVIFSSLLSTPLAFILSRTKFAKYRRLDLVLMIPFMTPPYISSMGRMLFMQKRGLFQQLFPATGDFSEKFFSLGGLVMVMTFHVYPFMTGILKNAILNLGDDLDESARVAGGSFSYRLRRVTLPLLTGNYAIAMLLVFVKTLSEYGTPSTLGNKIGFYVFTTDIHKYASTAPIDFGKAASLSSVLILICMLMWLIQNKVTENHTYDLVGSSRKGDSENNKKSNVISGIFLALVILISIGIPYFSIIATSLIKIRGLGLQKGNFTLGNFKDLFVKNPKGLQALLTSTGLALISATLASLLGFFLVIFIRKRKKGGKVLEFEALLPQMLPNIVLVIGLMLFWNKIYKAIPLYNTLAFMVLVYVVMFLPYSVQYTSSALLQMGEGPIEAAKVSGASSSYILRKVVFPLVKGGVFQGRIMTFIIVFRELVAASLISPPNVLTVSTFIVNEFEQGSASIAMAMALVCILITLALLLILDKLVNKKKVKA